jgi:hypothetical protein
MSIKTPFKDAIETSVSKGSAVNDKHSPSSSGSPLKTMFGDALETKVPNTRTGGALPEVLIDGGIASPPTGLQNLPEPGKKFTIG